MTAKTKAAITVTHVDSDTRLRVISQGPLADAAAMLVGAYDDGPDDVSTNPITMFCDGGVKRQAGQYEAIKAEGAAAGAAVGAKQSVDKWRMNIGDDDQRGIHAPDLAPSHPGPNLSGLLHPAGPPTLTEE